MGRIPPFFAFSGFYAAVFLSLGILIPFWPLWLGHRGLSGEAVGLLLACAAWARSAALPAIGYIADGSGRPRGVLLLLAVLSLGLFLTFPAAQGLWALLLVQVLFALASHPLIPLAESQALAAARRGLLDYGRMRLWCSLSFIAGSLGAGAVLARFGPDLLITLVTVALAATALAATQLPAGGAPAGARARPADLAALVTRPGFLLFLGAAGLLQASHAAYYGFSALHWRLAGYDETAIAWLWSEGVVAEVLLFLAGTRLLARLGPRGLLILAAAGALLRWSLTALSTELPVLLAAQSLHALTFGAAHLGAMHFLSQTVPAALSATAQTLYAALSGGLLMGLAALLSGRLYEADPAAAFGAMAGLGAVALVCALLLPRHGTSDSGRIGQR